MPIYTPGNEPAELQAKLKSFFAKIDEFYPDKVVVSLQNAHKKQGEKLTALYKALGYSSGAEMMEAYGYTYVKKKRGLSPAEKEQRKLEILPVIVKTLQGSGETFETLLEIQQRYPDLADDIKLCQLSFNGYMGYARLPDYFKACGIIVEKEKKVPVSILIKGKCDEIRDALGNERLGKYTSLEELLNDCPEVLDVISQLRELCDGDEDKLMRLLLRHGILCAPNKKDSEKMEQREDFEKALSVNGKNTKSTALRKFGNLIKRSYGLAMADYLKLRFK